MTTPSRAGATTQSAYIIVDDADTHYARAKAAGAEIVMDIEDQDYGGRVYSCRDPECHLSIPMIRGLFISTLI